MRTHACLQAASCSSSSTADPSSSLTAATDGLVGAAEAGTAADPGPRPTGQSDCLQLWDAIDTRRQVHMSNTTLVSSRAYSALLQEAAAAAGGVGGPKSSVPLQPLQPDLYRTWLPAATFPAQPLDALVDAVLRSYDMRSVYPNGLNDITARVMLCGNSITISSMLLADDVTASERVWQQSAASDTPTRSSPRTAAVASCILSGSVPTDTLLQQPPSAVGNTDPWALPPLATTAQAAAQSAPAPWQHADPWGGPLPLLDFGRAPGVWVVVANSTFRLQRLTVTGLPLPSAGSASPIFATPFHCVQPNDCPSLPTQAEDALYANMSLPL